MAAVTTTGLVTDPRTRWRPGTRGVAARVAVLALLRSGPAGRAPRAAGDPGQHLLQGHGVRDRGPVHEHPDRLRRTGLARPPGLRRRRGVHQRLPAVEVRAAVAPRGRGHDRPRRRDRPGPRRGRATGQGPVLRPRDHRLRRVRPGHRLRHHRAHRRGSGRQRAPSRLRPGRHRLRLRLPRRPRAGLGVRLAPDLVTGRSGHRGPARRRARRRVVGDQRHRLQAARLRARRRRGGTRRGAVRLDRADRVADHLRAARWR